MVTNASPSRVSNVRKEARRRAGIVRRYVALEAPTLQDDDRFAAELELSRDMLYQLARSWRRHGDPALLPGAYTRTTLEDRRSALEAAEDPDLSAVDPARRRKIRRLLAELQKFLALENPTVADEERSVRSLGMSRAAFRRLQRSWILARNPAALPGGSTSARTPRRHRQTIPPAVERLIVDVIEELGSRSNALAVHRLVERRCAEAGLKPPGKATVHQRFLETRARFRSGQGDPMVATDHVALQLQTLGAGGPQYPVLSVLLETPSGHILAHRLSLAAPTAASTAWLLADFLEGVPAEAAKTVPLDIASPKTPEWDEVLRILKKHGVEVLKTRTRALRPGRHLVRLLGDRLDRFLLRPGLTSRPDAGHMRRLGGDSAPLTLEEARTVVADVVARHNREHAPIGIPSVTRMPLTRPLAQALRSNED